jgi:hypothetical protein
MARHLQNIAATTRSLVIPGLMLSGVTPSFKKLLALSWIAFDLGPFRPMISSFLSSSSSVAMKNFSRATMLEFGLRFLAGGIAVSAFAALGETLRPKSFAGLFGAVPSIALGTLLITLSQKGAPFAAVEGSSMIVGAFALALYS